MYIISAQYSFRNLLNEYHKYVIDKKLWNDPTANCGSKKDGVANSGLGGSGIGATPIQFRIPRGMNASQARTFIETEVGLGRDVASCSASQGFAGFSILKAGRIRCHIHLPGILPQGGR